MCRRKGSTETSVIVTGTQAQVDAVAARHGTKEVIRAS
jgi:hypothetical protein